MSMCHQHDHVGDDNYMIMISHDNYRDNYMIIIGHDNYPDNNWS